MSETAGTPTNELAQTWLELQCRMIPQVRRAFVGLAPVPGGGFASGAAWSAHAEGSADPASCPDLVAVAAAAYEGRDTIVREAGHAVDADRSGPPGVIIGAPVLRDAGIFGAAALELASLEESHRALARQLLDWGSVWLALMLHQGAARGQSEATATCEVMAAALAHERCHPAATGAVTTLATLFDSERVAIGLSDGGAIRFEAISHSSQADRRASLVQDLEAAMEEAVEAQDAVLVPRTDGQAPAAAHERLVARHECVSALSIPLVSQSQTVAALTLERTRGVPFTDFDAQRLTQAVALLGPVLEMKRREDRWIGAKLRDTAGTALRRLLGASAGARLAFGAAAIVLLGLGLASGEHRVSGSAELEGSQHRALAAPIDGYIEEVHARSGDTVSAGDLIAEIDTSALRLERRRWVSERDDLRNQYRSAVARLERGQAKIVEAQIGRAEAQIELIDEQLAHARITAPFDGLLISGDLTRAIGTPVERGQTLFELAPPDGYYVNVLVDESDIASIAPGQQGEVLLSALPGQPLAIVVEQVTEVAQIEDGRNGFRVLARVEEDGAALRPGMRGVARIGIERRRLLWIWTHGLVERARLFFWTHAP